MTKLATELAVLQYPRNTWHLESISFRQLLKGCWKLLVSSQLRSALSGIVTMNLPPQLDVIPRVITVSSVMISRGSTCEIAKAPSKWLYSVGLKPMVSSESSQTRHRANARIIAPWLSLINISIPARLTLALMSSGRLLLESLGKK